MMTYRDHYTLADLVNSGMFKTPETSTPGLRLLKANSFDDFGL